MHTPMQILSDKELLERMFERDFLTRELFTRVYGLDTAPFAAYVAGNAADRSLPHGVRTFCLEFIAGKHPRLLS